MPRRRANPDACDNGHDLRDMANVYVTPAGKRECRRCAHNRVRRHRRRMGPPPTKREKEDAMTPTEVERFLAQGLAEEIAPAWEKPAHRRMWQPRGSEADRQR